MTDPEGKRPLTLGEAASAQSFQLTEAGYYQLRLANGRQNEVGVNPDPKESNLDVIPGRCVGPVARQRRPAFTRTHRRRSRRHLIRRRKRCGGTSCFSYSPPPSPNRS